MQRRLVVALSLLVSSLLSACAGEDSSLRPPNLVMIIGDDAGYHDFGFMGSTLVQTPNLDRLADESFVFTHGFSSASVCRPALRSLLTGFDPYQWRHRFGQLAPAQMLRGIRNFTTLPELLGEHGYTSYAAGKFWEGSYAAAGFDGGMAPLDGDPVDGRPEKVLGRQTLDPVFDFLQTHREGPFFLWFAPMLPHLPHDAPDRLLARYDDAGLSRHARLYYANLSWLDEVVGDLLARLDELELRDETLVVYLNDNGWDQAPQGHRLIPLRDGPRGKQTLHELGLRTPILLRWPQRIPAGERSDSLVSILDLFPTLLEYASVPVPSDRPGRSLRPIIEAKEAAPRRKIVNWMARSRTSPERPPKGPDPWLNLDPAYSLRNEKWRYLWHSDDDYEELYDLEEDPEERWDVAWKYPEIAARLRNEIAQWRAEMERPFGGHAAKPAEASR